MADHSKRMREEQEARRRDLESRPSFKPRVIETRAHRSHANSSPTYRSPRDSARHEESAYGGRDGIIRIASPEDAVRALVEIDDRPFIPRRWTPSKHVPLCQFKSSAERKAAKRNEAASKKKAGKTKGR